MSNTKIYTYDVIGYVQKKENKTNSQGDYLQLNFTPLECQKHMIFFVAPKFKNGKINDTHKKLTETAEGSKVCLTYSLNNNQFFLWNIQEV